jgi:hypothetical protein
MFGMSLFCLCLLLGRDLWAIGWLVWFAQVTGCLFGERLRQFMFFLSVVNDAQICYNGDRSRICTLKTKYHEYFKRGQLQNPPNPFRD